MTQGFHETAARNTGEPDKGQPIPDQLLPEVASVAAPIALPSCDLMAALDTELARLQAEQAELLANLNAKDV